MLGLPSFEILLACALLGGAAGYLGGLIGIGGGFVLVPGFLWLNRHMGMEESQAMLTAVATSMTTMIITAWVATRRHRRLGNVVLDLSRAMSWPLFFGAFAGAILATKVPVEILKTAFAAFCLYSGFRMLRTKHAEDLVEVAPVETIVLSSGDSSHLEQQVDVSDGMVPWPTPTPAQPLVELKPAVVSAPSSFDGLRKGFLRGASFFIGAFCGALGVGGANLTVSLLMKKYAVKARHAMATASTTQVAIGLAGSLGYALMGYQKGFGLKGYVSMPMFLIASGMSLATAYVGASHSVRFRISRLKLIFGWFTILIGARMVQSAFVH